MFSYLSLINFKSFKDIFFDLRYNNQEIKKVVILYGENGSGKTNLVQAFSLLSNSIRSLSLQSTYMEMLSKNDARFGDDYSKNRFSNIFGKLTNVIDINVERSYMLGTLNEDMILEFGFRFNDADGFYKMIFDKKGLKEEELYHLLNKNRGTIFKISRDRNYLSKLIFHNENYKNELLTLVDKYWGKHTFLSILTNETITKNLDYILKNLDSSLLELVDSLNFSSQTFTNNNDIMNTYISKSFNILSRLESGKVNNTEDNKNKIKVTEMLLDQFFTSIYSDIKFVYYKQEITNDKIEYNLYLKKIIGGKICDIDFNLESTGTKNLLELFIPLINSVMGGVSIIDEADTGIHDLLFTELMVNIIENIKGQLIITTHNTTLLERLDKSLFYFIYIDSDGNKEILNVDDFDSKTQKSHNMRDRYLKGIYGGVPILGNIDFSKLEQILIDNNCFRDSDVDE